MRQITLTHEADISARVHRNAVERTIVFSDVVDSTTYADLNGDESYVELLDEHDRIVRGALLTAGGELVKTTGDGAMLAFVDPADAVAAALDVQRNAISARIPLRIGADHGPVIEYASGDYRGLVANIAARLTSLAAAGEVKVTDRVARPAGVAGVASSCPIRGVRHRQHVQTLTVLAAA